MYFIKQQPPPPTPEPDGIEIKVKLSESTLIKLIPVVAALLVGSGLVGSGLWVHTQPADSPSDASEVSSKS